MNNKRNLKGSKKITLIKNDLDEFQHIWEEIFKRSNKDQSAAHLKKLSDSILNLDNHAAYLKEQNELKEEASMIDYLLKTPWGAPFVSETTFLGAALEYQAFPSKTSSLCRLIKQFHSYEEKIRLPVLESLEEIRQNLKTRNFD